MIRNPAHDVTIASARVEIDERTKLRELIEKAEKIGSDRISTYGRVAGVDPIPAMSLLILVEILKELKRQK